jgi:hypothetical protein
MLIKIRESENCYLLNKQKNITSKCKLGIKGCYKKGMIKHLVKLKCVLYLSNSTIAMTVA